ncbi:cytochrome P450 [Gloeophyllum trabeum ATCC 11539]|uniref:Cytochrome P450 n=1 Tax=Gloeophyllum trabeum (strain ATCC 11539 / FP-39264 / Madison 617) TaxID=670483 RepID=S7RQH2_GLOTA|nr:cytochrome P450 [Gloeophyllum trabeum ATCC 11539]EPQ56835.1 cytochrome P450 [Gloeophyllum trabeum ATCC 11539]
MTSPVALALAVAVLAYALMRLSGRRRLPYLPGPKPLPVLGNLLQMPTEREWLVFAEWAMTYGDCIHLTILGQSIVVLNSFEAASDLLEKRSAAYSSRPRLVMAGELVGFARAMALMPYTERFRQLRRMMQKELTGAALQKYWPLHEHDSRHLVLRVVQRPTDIAKLVRHYAGSVILKVTYGYQTEPENDPFLVLAEKVMGAFSVASKPGNWLVDFITWLRHLPDWVPGTRFKQVARELSDLHMQVIEGPYNWALPRQDTPEVIKPNFVSTVLVDKAGSLTAEDNEILLWSSASLFGGGADTTVSAITSFYLAMALYPEVQAKGRAEIDRVIGTQRLPQLTDQRDLPYVEAIMREVLRWNPVAPLGVPHLSTQDDVYRDRFIPSGTIVMPNIWVMLHDPVIFPNPHEFNPDRFLGDEVAVKRSSVAFGFGRRVCPGMTFAESSVFIAIATALATCEMSDAVDEHGTRISREVTYKTGTISHPPSFTCRVTARSKSHVDLLEASLAY